MEAKIIKEEQNPLFNRKEVILEVEAETIPNHADAEKIISEKFSTQPDAFKIKKIDSKFGSKTFTIIANIYASKKDKGETEVKTKQEKEAEKKAEEERLKAEAEAKAAAEKPAEEAPAEEAGQSAEEKTEEAPKEEETKEEKSE